MGCRAKRALIDRCRDLCLAIRGTEQRVMGMAGLRRARGKEQGDAEQRQNPEPRGSLDRPTSGLGEAHHALRTFGCERLKESGNTPLVPCSAVRAIVRPAH